MEQVVEFFAGLFSPEGFPARWYCGKWTDFHGWVYITANILIWSAYFAIPILLANIALKRPDLPFRRIFWLFVAFILLCGSTHIMDAIIFWFPAYRFNGLLLSVTGVVSWLTVGALVKLMPEALSLRTTRELEAIIAEKTQALQEANAALQQSEASFKALVNSNPDFIARVDAGGRYQFVNHSSYRILGVHAQEMLHKPIGEVERSPSAQQPLKELVNQAFDSSQTRMQEISFDHENTALHNRTMMVTAVPLMVESTSTTAEEVLLISRDVTLERNARVQAEQNISELRQLSRQLAEKNRQFEDMAHIVTHNLRSPIGNYRALLELIDKEPGEEKRNLLLSKIKEVTNELATTVEDLTTVFKARQDLWAPREKIAFDAKLQNVLAGLSELVRLRDAQITFDFAECPTVEYPRVYLKSILQNLLSNALKYAHPDRQPIIHCHSWENDGITHLSVRDNGLGIDLEKYGSKLFGMKKTFHNHPDARGVGLFITKNQVEAMGGTIWAESTPGEGSEFTVAFNQAADSADRLQRIFVVDDDNITRFTLQRDISRLGMVQELESFVNGEAAFEQIKAMVQNNEPLPDAIILDLDMPLMDGWEFLDACKELLADAPKLPHIVVSSSTASESSKEQVRKHPLVWDFVPKPLTEDVLVQVLNSILRNA